MSIFNSHSVLSRLAVALSVAGLCFASNVHAGLASVPLSVANSVDPNLILVLDDSGSMDWEMLFPTDSGQLQINNLQNDRGYASPIHWDGSIRVSGGTSYSYLFPNGTGTGNKVYGYTSGNGKALPPRPEYAFARSSDYNGQFYDPMVTYQPWIKADGSFYPAANPKSAISDPAVTGSNTMDLTTENYTTSGNWGFYRSNYMYGADNGYPVASYGSSGSDGDLGKRTYSYRYVPATYYVRVKSATLLPVWLNSWGTCASLDHDRYLEFLTKWTPANQTLLEAAGVDAIGIDGACLKKYEIPSATSFPSGRTQADELQNFANWFQYYRKRHLALRAGLGVAFADKSGMSVGGFEINKRKDVSMWSIDSKRGDLFSFIYDRPATSNSTPNRAGLKFAGGQYASKDKDIIKYACQQNFTLQFTDGYNNQWISGIGDADGDNGAPYADSMSNTAGDIAMYYYENRLRTDLPAGKVPVRAECSTSSPPAWMDCNQDLHMNTYGITLGAQGQIFGVTHHTVKDAYTAPPSWPTSDDGGREQVDDLYHAAVNGRGQMFNAKNSTELSQKLSEALKAILGSVISSASVVSSNSTRLDTSTVLYQAQFDSKDWSGRLLKIDIGTDGTIGAVQADAATAMPTHGSRKIFTRDGEFKWGSLSAAVQNQFNVGPNAVMDGLGEQRVNWIRGDQSNEQDKGGALRTRTYVLGDIVDSSPTFVGGLDFGYDILPNSAGGDTYRQYVIDNKTTRSKVVYVGANDGMVHAFDADTLVEKFAYMPTEHVLSGQLPRLSDPNYKHRFFVDGTPVASDVYLGGSWKTYL
ncbi:MAG: hypothetical protein KDI75_01735, partial [Xanthomonadales bacterium]|nr:hypothetical protein [Xanthomonadales bacterium]